MKVYKDEHGLTYYFVKKNGNYYLLEKIKQFQTKKYIYKVEVKGKENIIKYIKNNGLKRCVEDEK